MSTKKSPEKPIPTNGQDLNAAETLYKCLSERLGGSHLEELSVSECGLDTDHVRKIVDGAMMCGISRLGLAGNQLTDEGLGHVIHYLRSGICHGLDLGGNDLRGKLGPIADTFNEKPDCPCWGLSLADCNLDTQSVKPLLPALVKLSNFRFIDLSHNRDLCSEDNGTISLLRRYIPQMRDLKRIHMSDVGMSTKQAIALAEVLPEGPRLAHLSILENPQLKALANATDEASQEEACALYASLMTAVRVSKTLICIDIDVSTPNVYTGLFFTNRITGSKPRKQRDRQSPRKTGRRVFFAQHGKLRYRRGNRRYGRDCERRRYTDCSTWWRRQREGCSSA
jgi:hypothetical protein